MTPIIKFFSLFGTLLITTALSLAILGEPDRQKDASNVLLEAMIAEGTGLYAENCVACHGASGEGMMSYPPLATLSDSDSEVLYKTIERGRYNTSMAGFGINEGGNLTDMQIKSLVTLIHTNTWDTVSSHVAELGLTPPQIVVAELSEETLIRVKELPNGESLATGMTVYAENCVACHGANGEGTSIAPPLNTDELRIRVNEAELTRILQEGVAGTLMASWKNALTPSEQQSVVNFISQWGILNAMNVSLPVLATTPLDNSPQAVATGKKLFELLCTQCHGTEGYGSRIAPALNNQLFLSQTPDGAIQQIISGGVTGTSMPSWSGYLTEADITAITVYLRSLQPTAPLISPTQP